ncbi:hypothetical protein AVEN_160299-1 [Araneus ventricosus]|uniref:Uncharacterized protein n=1 Tax=Araneus ventricosus TaxID=182803 RepID=A0A4Y2L4P2_ARAVE|nr:hypothetical protein AVEN_160299-1 [Araneus ventricosus]
MSRWDKYLNVLEDYFEKETTHAAVVLGCSEMLSIEFWRSCEGSWRDVGLGAGGLQARNSISVNTRHVLGQFQAKLYVGGQTSSRWCGVEVWRGRYHSGVALDI